MVWINWMIWYVVVDGGRMYEIMVNSNRLRRIRLTRAIDHCDGYMAAGDGVFGGG